MPRFHSARAGKEEDTHGTETILYHHAHLLPVGQAAHRPHLLHGGDRRDGALQAPDRLRRDVPDRNGRARSEDRGQGQGRGRDPAAVRGQHRLRREGYPRSVEADEHLQRPLHPHHRRLPRRGHPEDLQEDARQRRHLQGQVCRQILQALRELLDREPARGRQVPRLRA